MSTGSSDSCAECSQMDPVIAMRMEGKRYPEIASALGIAVGTARLRIKRAVERNIVTARQVSYRAQANAQLADDAYNLRWLERAKRRCVISPTGCWLWQGCVTATGYSLIGYRHTNRGGHRLMYKVYYGVALKTEQYVLHKCDVRNCINPEHLWIGTAKDNNTDCAGKGRHFEGTKTYCDHGHPLFGDNVRICKQHPPKMGIRRVCRACERARFATPEYKAQTAERARRKRQERRIGEQRV